MAMKELLRVTLDAAKIREACELYVASRIQPDEEATATLIVNVRKPETISDPGSESVVCEVVVRKRRVRKLKQRGPPPPQEYEP